MGQIIALLIFASILLGSLFSLINWNNSHLDRIDKIVSIQDNHSPTGSFFLGIGSISDATYYFYYRQNDDNSFELQKVDTDYAKIIEIENKENTRVEVWSLYKYIFYIPKNSITREFKLDAK